MCGNGVRTGMAITQVHRRLTHRDQAIADIVFFGAVPGTTLTHPVGLPIAARSLRSDVISSTVSGAAAFVWFFRRTNVSPYTQFRDSGI